MIHESYEQAAVRHWSDGQLLEREQRLPNADQLYGFAAECALKVALQRLPTCRSEAGLNPGWREHVDALWARSALQGLQKLYPGLMALLRTPNPFHDWTTDHRYADDTAVTPEAAARHRNAARRLIGAVGVQASRTEA